MGRPFHPQSRRTQGRPITAYGDRGVVSVPLPAVSGGASRHHASCDEGGTSPGDPRGPSTDSRQGRRIRSRLKGFPTRGPILYGQTIQGGVRKGENRAGGDLVE